MSPNYVLFNKRYLGILGVILGLLLIPFVAMQFSSEVNWSLFDFVVMGGLLLITGTLIELVLGLVKDIRYRIAIAVFIFAAFLLVWAEIAVGIFGTPFAGS